MNNESLWEKQFKDQAACRWFPNEELCRFLGRTYGPVVGEPGTGKLAAEIGCGCGGNLAALASYGFYVDGYDISHEALRLAAGHMARWSLQDHVSLQYYIAPDPLPVTDGFYDLVVDIQCIQHLGEQAHAGVYREIFRTLKSGGRFLSVHWDSGDQEKLFPQHPELSCVTTTRAMDMLEESGLDVDAASLVGKWYDVNMCGFAAWATIEAHKP